jgi:hypothetical protein
MILLTEGESIISSNICWTFITTSVKILQDLSTLPLGLQSHNLLHVPKIKSAALKTSHACTASDTTLFCSHTPLTSYYTFKHLVQLQPLTKQITTCSSVQMTSSMSMFTAQNLWHKCTIKVRPAPQCQYRNRQRKTPHTSCQDQPAMLSAVKNVPSLQIITDLPSHFVTEAILGCNILFTAVCPQLYGIMFSARFWGMS